MRIYQDSRTLARDIFAHLGSALEVGLPLGIGKATHVINALFEEAEKDRSLTLDILTALTLERPRASSELEARFLAPFVERHFKGYVDLSYAVAARRGDLPGNVRVSEFFLNSGAWLSHAGAQQNYVSANYTAAGKALLDKRINLLAQLIAIDESGPEPRYSLACNPDVTLDILPELKRRKEAGEKIWVVGQVNRSLPFMPGSAEVPADTFDTILDTPEVEFPIFAAPKRPVATEDYVAGLHAASLVKDGGTLQIGIGSLGDAVTYALILRHKHNALFKELIARIAPDPDGSLPRETEPFSEGLYASSEMFVEGFLDLYEAGILKREVAGGHVLHGAFFVGSHSFYDRLRKMSEAERRKFDMVPVSFTNSLYGDEERKRADRKNARFVNNTMIATLLGAAASDTLDSGKVVSGVGGQHDFVEQAHAMADARSFLMLNAVRRSGGKTKSNVLWTYAAATIPRHQRDIFITEYGVADLWGCSDRECILRMLAISDQRFQKELHGAALKAGKIEPSDPLPPPGNMPGKLEDLLESARSKGFFPRFPFGSDFTQEEQCALIALGELKAAGKSRGAMLRLFWEGMRAPAPDGEQRAALERLKLLNGGWKDFLYRTLMKGAWSRARGQR